MTGTVKITAKRCRNWSNARNCLRLMQEFESLKVTGIVSNLPIKLEGICIILLYGLESSGMTVTSRRSPLPDLI